MPSKKPKPKAKTKTKRTTKRASPQRYGKKVRIDEDAAQAAREKAFRAEAEIMLANAEEIAKTVRDMAPAHDTSKASSEAMAQMKALCERMLYAKPPE